MGNNAQKDALQIVNLPAHVAVSLTKQYYIPLVNVNWAGCYGQTIVMCKDLTYMKKVTDRTCIASLLRKERSEIVKLCLLDYLLNPNFGEMAIYLKGGEVLVVSAEKEGQLICGNLTPVPKIIENYARTKIGCDRAFQTKGAWIPYILRACDQWTGECEVSYPGNKLLEARLNVPTWRENMTGLLPREAPIMIAADPIPTDMRTDIQHAAKGFEARVPLTDLMHKKTVTKKRRSRKSKESTKSTARILLQIRVGDLQWGVWNFLHIPDHHRGGDYRNRSLEMLEKERRRPGRQSSTGRARRNDTQNSGQPSRCHQRRTEGEDSLRIFKCNTNVHNHSGCAVGSTDDPDLCSGMEKTAKSPKKDCRRPLHTVFHSPLSGDIVFGRTNNSSRPYVYRGKRSGDGRGRKPILPPIHFSEHTTSRNNSSLQETHPTYVGHSQIHVHVDDKATKVLLQPSHAYTQRAVRWSSVALGSFRLPNPTTPHAIRGEHQIDIAELEPRAGTGAVYEPLT